MLLGVSYASAQIVQVYWPQITVNGKPYGPIYWYVNASATVNTPKGNPVPVLLWHSDDWTTSQKNDLKNACIKAYSGITFEAEATTKYNCHAYAWDGGTTIWMNPPNQKEYWDDGSYLKITTTPPAGAKVRYTTLDHSAITTSTSGVFSSKWGAAPQFKHPVNVGLFPATTSEVEYYVRPSISGPDFIGASCSATYTIGVPSTGISSYFWEVLGGAGSYLSPTSSSSSSFTVSRTSSDLGPDDVTIRCTFTYDSQTYTVDKTIAARMAPTNVWLTDLYGYIQWSTMGMGQIFANATAGQPTYLVAYLAPGQSQHVIECEWIIVGGFPNFFTSPGVVSSTSVVFDYPGMYDVFVRVHDPCGWNRIFYSPIQVF